MLKKLVTLALLILSLSIFAQERFALVIGNADYQVSPLKNALNDAQDITQALEALDFKVTLLENADRRTMRETIYNFGNQLNKDTVGLFYYSGHAVQYRGENYLIPINALSSIKELRHLDDEAVPLGYVSGEVSARQSQLNFIFLDACRDNPFPAESRGISQGLAKSQNSEGTLIAYSTSPGRTAEDGIGRNSPYTKNLLKFINTPNQPIELMLKKVKTAVSNDTNGIQLPWYESSISGNFCFNTTSEGCAEFVQVIYDSYLKGIYDIETLEFQNGNQYTGQVINGLMHGKGVLTEPSGIKYKGEFFKGLKHGQGTVLFKNGNKFEGEFLANKKNGLGLSTFINGAKVHSRWKAGKQIFLDEDSYFDGPFLVLNGSSDNQLIVFEKKKGELDDILKVPHGYGIYYDRGGSSKEGEYEKGYIKELVKYTLASGDIYTGVTSNLNGQGTFISNNGEIKEGMFQYGLLNGPGKRTWANGDKYIGEFKDGYMHGQGTKTLHHGQVRSGEYKYGKLNGLGKQLFIDGSIYEGNWLNDQASGYGTFDALGKKGYKHKGQWKNDLENGYGTIDGNDGNRYKGDFKDGLLHGQGKWFYEDGGTYVGEFKDGHMNGYGVINLQGWQYKGNFKNDSFHGSGIFISDEESYEGEFLSGVFHGEFIFTNSEGTKFIEIYENDERISSTQLTN